MTASLSCAHLNQSHSKQGTKERRRTAERGIRKVITDDHVLGELTGPDQQVMEVDPSAIQPSGLPSTGRIRTQPVPVSSITSTVSPRSSLFTTL